jgi:putative flippase GtrA
MLEDIKAFIFVLVYWAGLALGVAAAAALVVSILVSYFWG